MGLTILLVDKHVLFREGLAHLLSQLDAKANILEAGNWTEVAAHMGNLPGLDLTLVGMNDPVADAMGLVGLFRERYPLIPLAVIADPEYRHDIVAALRLGISGFIPKSSPGNEMLSALRIILDGRCYLPFRMCGDTDVISARGRQQQGDSPAVVHGMTPRQFEVMHALAEGLSYREIGKRSGISTSTVRVHVASVYRLLGVNGRMRAIAVAQQRGILGLGGFHELQPRGLAAG